MLRPVALAAWSILLVACGDPCDLPEARGGTEEERAVAEAEAEAFLGQLRDEVCVPRIRLGQLRGTSLGKYTPGSRRIKVQEGRALSDIRTTVRHEICHAVQFQQDLDLSGPEWSLALPVDVPDDERAGESWAYTCQLGPEPAYLMGATCPDDPDGTSVFGQVRDVFVRPADVVDRPVAFEEVGRIHVGEGEVTWGPTVDGGLQVERAGGEVETVDLETGSPAPPAAPLEGSADTGEAELRFLVAFAANGATGFRLVYEDAAGATRAGCPREGEVPFASGGALWSAFRDGDDLVWGRWSVD